MKYSSIKNDKVNFLRKELRENPEFDLAFPHLKRYKNVSKIKRESVELDFLDTLTDEHRVYGKKREDEIDYDNSR